MLKERVVQIVLSFTLVVLWGLWIADIAAWVVTCQATIIGVIIHVKSFQKDCVAHFLSWQECGLVEFANVIDNMWLCSYIGDLFARNHTPTASHKIWHSHWCLQHAIHYPSLSFKISCRTWTLRTSLHGAFARVFVRQNFICSWAMSLLRPAVSDLFLWLGACKSSSIAGQQQRLNLFSTWRSSVIELGGYF